MYYFGTNLEERFAVPDFWPKAEHSHKIPLEREEIDKELERLERKRKWRRSLWKELEEQETSSAPPSSIGESAAENGATTQGKGHQTPEQR